MNQAELDQIIENHHEFIMLNGASGKYAKLDGQDMSGLDFKGANLQGCSAIGAIFIDANLNDVNFEAANLTNAKLKGASLNFTNFERVTINGSDLLK